MSYNNVYSTINSYTNKSRFCYSYKPPGPVENCCNPVVCATNEFVSSISSLTMVTNNSTRTSERSLLLYGLQQQLVCNQAAQVNSTVQSTINNSTMIANTIYGQLLQVRQQRYEPFQPYIPPVIPPSVIQLQMATVNVGVPHSVFTCADGKGVQFVTT
jgi:hypothetical protein